MTRRRDARRNRERIVLAAKRVFAHQGVEAPLELVYSEAGVGRATFYRNFSGRKELIHGIYEQQLDHLEALASEEAFGSLRRVIEGYAVQVTQSPNLISIFVEGPEQLGTLGPLRTRYLEFVSELLEQSISRGEVPPSTSIEDVHVLLAMVQGAILLLETPGAWSRTRLALRVVDSYFEWS